MSILNHPSKLYKLGVRGVINMCYEYPGPKSDYSKLGIRQLRLPTVDHVEPKVELYEEAIKFIKYHQERNEKVYIHCKAGHGRAASVAFAWMIHENQDKDPSELNAALRKIRHVRKTLFKQKNILNFISRLGSYKSLTHSDVSESTIACEDSVKLTSDSTNVNSSKSD